MIVEPRGHGYPAQSLRVRPFSGDLVSFFAQPVDFLPRRWPTDQVAYLSGYLSLLNCQTVVVEEHYIDRDFVDDVALFYSRSLRSYANHCRRLHFFSTSFDESGWRAMLTTANRGAHRDINAQLQAGYVGFSVLRPLPGSPVGRTVLSTLDNRALDGSTRRFEGARRYAVHLAGFDLEVSGLAFQQQDQGVSACATTALWTALNRVASLEGIQVPTPATITQAACRHYLPGGRPLPSEGLTLEQICEACRAVGLAPTLVRGSALAVARAHVYCHLKSGLTPLLAIQIDGHTEGHAVCAVGFKEGAAVAAPGYSFRDEATSVAGLYVHDDRLGPYAAATLEVRQDPKEPTRELPILRIKWPGKTDETAVIRAIVAPMPVKIRLSVNRLRTIASALADLVATRVIGRSGELTVGYCYRLSTDYLRSAYQLGLSADGIVRMTGSVAMSRYVGEVTFYLPEGPVFDVLIDATETEANPAWLLCVARSHCPDQAAERIRRFAEQKLNVPFLR